jgi:beta-galactosidase GanA
VEITTRKTGDRQWIFVLNHSAKTQEASLPGRFMDLLTGTTHSGKIALKPYDVLVLQAA